MWSFSIIAPALEELNTIYIYICAHIHALILEQNITSKTKFITGLSLYLERRKRDSPGLWKLLLADKSVEPSFQRIWASYSHPHQYSGDRQKILEARAKIEAFLSKRKTLASGYLFSSNFAFSLPTILFIFLIDWKKLTVSIILFLPEEATGILHLLLHR